MIAKLSGRIVDIHSNNVTVDVGGVGYRVEMLNPDLLEGQEVELYIHTHVREQELRLFGFKSSKALSVFERLIEVSGVGPKVALSLIYRVGADKVIYAIRSGEPALLKSPGVGMKTAERIVIDLKSKLAKSHLTDTSYTHDPQLDNKEREISEALKQLGYTSTEVSRAVEKLDLAGHKTSQLIKLALKSLSKSV